MAAPLQLAPATRRDKISNSDQQTRSNREQPVEAPHLERDSIPVFERARDLLIEWAFKAGRYQTGWGTLERTMLALVTLALWKEELQLVPWLKVGIAKRLTKVAVDHKILDRAAHDLRRQAASLRPREFEMDRVRHAMNQLDPAKVRTLLVEIADILSPGTVGERVHPDFF